MAEQFDETGRTAPHAWQDAAVQIARTVRFFSRLPVPRLPFESAGLHEAPSLPAMAPFVPVAGLIIGILPGLVLVGAFELGLGTFLAGTLSVAVATLVTGGLHEDGLADTADSIGGMTPERRLAIMRDSRIGAYGACALILCFALRIGALAGLAVYPHAFSAALAVMVVASLSRTASLMPLVFLPPARMDGSSHSVGRPSRESLWLAAAIASGLALAVGLVSDLTLAGVTVMAALAALTGWGMTRFSSRHLGGQTGDIAGATQQLAEIAALLGLLIALGR